MLKYCLCLFLTILPCVLSAALLTNYPQELHNVVSTLQRLPEACSLIENVQRNGKIRIAFGTPYSDKFDAFWEGNSRTIYINRKGKRSLESLLCSILFELHNAASNRELTLLIHQASLGKIDKNSFVEKMERLEHRNALQTTQIIAQGRKAGCFPSTVKWPIIHDFDDHYKVQQLQGHSGWMATYYDSLYRPGAKQRFAGTIPNLASLTAKEKQNLLQRLLVKNNFGKESIAIPPDKIKSHSPGRTNF